MARVGFQLDFDTAIPANFAGAAKTLSELLQALQEPEEDEDWFSAPSYARRRPSTPPEPAPASSPSVSRVGGSRVLRSAGSASALGLPSRPSSSGGGRPSSGGGRPSSGGGRPSSGGGGRPSSGGGGPLSSGGGRPSSGGASGAGRGGAAPRGVGASGGGRGGAAPRGGVDFAPPHQRQPQQPACGLPLVRGASSGGYAEATASSDLARSLREPRPEGTMGEGGYGPAMRKATFGGRQAGAMGEVDDLFGELESMDKALGSGAPRPEDVQRLRSQLMAVLDGEGAHDAAASTARLLPPLSASRRSRLGAQLTARRPEDGITPLALTHRSDADAVDHATAFVCDVVDTCFDLEALLQGPGAGSPGFGPAPLSSRSSLPSARWTARAASAAAASAAAASAAAEKAAAASMAAAREAARAAAAARAASGRYDHIVDWVYAQGGDPMLLALEGPLEEASPELDVTMAAEEPAPVGEQPQPDALGQTSDDGPALGQSVNDSSAGLGMTEPASEQPQPDALGQTCDDGPALGQSVNDSSAGFGMTDKEESNYIEAEAREMDEALLREGGADTQQTVSLELWRLVMRLVGLDGGEGEAIWVEIEKDMRQQGKKRSPTGYPLREFIKALNVDAKDKEGIHHIVQATQDARAQLAKGGALDFAKFDAEVLEKTMYDKVVHKLFLSGELPPEDAWDLTVSGKVKLSAAERHFFETTIRTSAQGKETFTEKVRQYSCVPPVVNSKAGQVVCREACIAEVDRIVSECKAQGVSWTDPDWDMRKSPASVLYVDGEAPGWDCTVAPPAGYKRLTEIVGKSGSSTKKALGSLFGSFGGGAPAKKKKTKPKVFKGSARPRDIIQGQIGTCFLLGAIGAVASHNADEIEKMFIKYDVDVGVYGVRFNINGEWWYILVDDVFPVDEEGELLYARCRDAEEVWVPVLEKAYCKLHTCYEMCDGGMPTEAINIFFGGVTGSFPVKRKHQRNPASYFKDLSDAADKGWLMTTGFRAGPASSAGGKCGEAVSDNGLVAGHAYSLLRVEDVFGHKLLCLRNPWGQGEWTGKWSDENAEGEWTEELIEAVGKSFENDGRFWMSIEDFVEHTTGVDYARTFGPNWKKTTQYKHFRKDKIVADAIKTYRPSKPDELGLSVGDEVEVQEFLSSWWQGTLVATGSRGVFPGDCVKVRDRPISRFDLVGTPDADAGCSMTVVLILIQESAKLKRKFTRREEDGLNYKDTTHPDISLVVVGPDGSVAAKRDGRERILWVELELPGGGLWKVYAMSADGLGGSFTLRCYMKHGTVSFADVSGATFSELAPLL